MNESSQIKTTWSHWQVWSQQRRLGKGKEERKEKKVEKSDHESERSEVRASCWKCVTTGKRRKWSWKVFEMRTKVKRRQTGSAGKKPAKRKKAREREREIKFCSANRNRFEVETKRADCLKMSKNNLYGFEQVSLWSGRHLVWIDVNNNLKRLVWVLS